MKKGPGELRTWNKLYRQPCRTHVALVLVFAASKAVIEN
jgi:hypothetical protein